MGLLRRRGPSPARDAEQRAYRLEMGFCACGDVLTDPDVWLLVHTIWTPGIGHGRDACQDYR